MRMIIAVLAGVASTGVMAMETGVFGTDLSCGRFLAAGQEEIWSSPGELDNVLITPTELIASESSCALPAAFRSGEAFNVTCEGPEAEATTTIALTKEGSGQIVLKDDFGEIALHRCN